MRAVTRTAPLLLDHGRVAIGMPVLRLERGAGQGGLVALMAVAFAAIVVARLTSGGPVPAPGQVGAGCVRVAIGRGQSRTSGDTRRLRGADADPGPDRSRADTGSAQGHGGRNAAPAAKTYKVRSGDTLGGIAREFGTTVAVLQELNGIENPRLLKVGQVLKLP